MFTRLIRRRGALVAALLLMASSRALTAQSIRTGFTGGSLANDDDLSTLLDIGFSYSFYGLTSSTLWANNNGSATLDLAHPTFLQDPNDNFRTTALRALGPRILAPFYADVDTRASDAVTYGSGTVGTRAAFGINWLNVGYFDSHADKLNSFQLILINRNDVNAGDFDFEFNFGPLTWESSDAAGGTEGIGGDACARAGWASGAAASFELPGSGECGGLIDPVTSGTSALIAGDAPRRYLFEVRNGSVVSPTTTVPEPATNVLMASGLAALALIARRRHARRA